ncbi:DMT family transporter [Actibacterium pelagium]|uniref:Membrane protein n=1 Tax=Actibacterium pelagium TaxID=2029103 RepID=A0A917EGK2_9RHOB|nr:DMT family transporter [Actibacterium pelagium]GGE40808.1 membrane protein [Actibacterium pelagium]
MDNLRGIFLMTASMALFAIEDMFIKTVSKDLPIGQILALLGAGGFMVFAAIAAYRRQPLWTRTLLSRKVILRNGGELLGTGCFVYAFVFGDLYTATAIFQTLPLVITIGAALFMGAAVGWRRWTAISVGFAGVMMIIRPGFEGFDPISAIALIAVLGFAVRDLTTRVLPPSVTSLQLSAYGFGAVGVLGGLMMVLWEAPAEVSALNWVYLGLAIVVGTGGYYFIVMAMRVGEIAVVTPFRYSRLVFALIVSVTVFDEVPDQWSLLGAAIIIASGLYTLWREQRTFSSRARLAA